jgi:c-di-GMP-binding flagellar brake protein YcgR
LLIHPETPDDTLSEIPCEWRTPLRQEDGSKDTAGTSLDCRITRGDTVEGAPGVTKIPFKIDDEIMVRSLTNAAHRTKTRVVGAVHGDFILIHEPVVVINKRFVAVFDGSFESSYFTDGYRYSFLSRYRSHVFRGIVCIDYPQGVHIEQVRKHRRIRVNIESKYALIGAANWFPGDMLDISKGGCRIVLKPKTPMTEGIKVLLSFTLPNEDEVNDLRAVVVRSKPLPGGEETEVGFTFVGPPCELAKIESFCEFCLYFDLE